MPRFALLISLLLALVAAPTASATHQSPDPPPSYEEPVEPQDGEESEEWDEPPPQPEPTDPIDAIDATDPIDAVAPEWPPLLGDQPEDQLDPWPPVEQEPAVELVTTATVAGRQAMLRTDGKAAIPRGAPKRVRSIIAAGNRIAGKPYKWGGGHAKLIDRGYDCSGAVGFALIRAGLQSYPMVSGQYVRWGAAGAGRWVTIYANKGHVYMEIAGLRLDTSTAGYGEKGVRWRPVVGKRRGFKVRHPVGL